MADDDPRVRVALAALLAGEPDLEVVAQVGDGLAARAAASASAASVVLTDMRMPHGGPALIGDLVALPHRPVVVALSAQADVATWTGALAAGAAGYLLKGSIAQDLPVLLRRCVQGHLVVAVPGAAAAVRRLLG